MANILRVKGFKEYEQKVIDAYAVAFGGQRAMLDTDGSMMWRSCGFPFRHSMKTFVNDLRIAVNSDSLTCEEEECVKFMNDNGVGFSDIEISWLKDEISFSYNGVRMKRKYRPVSNNCIAFVVNGNKYIVKEK